MNSKTVMGAPLRVRPFLDPVAPRFKRRRSPYSGTGCTKLITAVYT